MNPFFLSGIWLLLSLSSTCLPISAFSSLFHLNRWFYYPILLNLKSYESSFGPASFSLHSYLHSYLICYCFHFQNTSEYVGFLKFYLSLLLTLHVYSILSLGKVPSSHVPTQSPHTHSHSANSFSSFQSKLKMTFRKL